MASNQAHEHCKPWSGLPDVIEYSGEFGIELVCFVPFIHWLKRAGLMRGRRVRTYEGMRSLYYFLGDDEYEERRAMRRFMHGHERLPFLPNRSEHSARKSAFEDYPDYRSKYMSPRIELQRPILVVHNKYNAEWDGPPVNFFDCETLDAMFARLKRTFSIVYIRHGRGSAWNASFSIDHNNQNQRFKTNDLDDAQVLLRHPDVLTLEDLQATLGIADVNLLKNRLYANTHFFITVQGGGSHQMALFRGSLQLILHRRGSELRHAYHSGYYRYMSNPAPILLVADSNERLLSALSAFETAKVIGDRVSAEPGLLKGLVDLIPKPTWRAREPAGASPPGAGRPA